MTVQAAVQAAVEAARKEALGVLEAVQAQAEVAVEAAVQKARAEVHAPDPTPPFNTHTLSTPLTLAPASPCPAPPGPVLRSYPRVMKKFACLHTSGR